MENNPQTEQDLKSKTNEIDSNAALAEENPESFEPKDGTDESKALNELKKLQDELAESKDKYLRLYSEFENFRRRSAKEKLDLIQSGNESLIKSLLPVVDDFERAEKSFQGSTNKESEGFLLIFNKLNKTLEQNGVKVMDLKAGDDFNADVHEAITQMPAPDEHLKGKVIDVIEKGYLLNDKVIRYAKVVVGQ